MIFISHLKEAIWVQWKDSWRKRSRKKYSK